MPRKKAQMMSQPFVYIFALILGALILVWGAKTVIDLVNTAKLVEVGQFKNDLDSEVQKFFYYEEDTSTNWNVKMPDKVAYVCLLDPDNYIKGKCKAKLKTGEIIEKDCESFEKNFKFVLDAESKKGENGNNLFFMPSTSINYSKFNIKHLKLSEGVLCFQNGGKMRLTSKVTHVEAS